MMDTATQEALIKRAQQRGYLEIKGERVRYYCRRQYEDDFGDPEEQVRAGVFAWLILEREYSNTQIDVEVTVPRRIPSDRADIVLYEDEACKVPYLVIETKARGIGEADISRAVEQAFGNTNSLRAKYALFDNLDTSSLYDVASFPSGERERNMLGTREHLALDFGRALEFRLIAGGDPGSSDIAAVTASELEKHVRRVHGLIWAGGMRDPLTAFNEWSKLMFAKVHDERHTPNGSPRKFQVGANENSVRVANRIRSLYEEARRADPSIFSEPTNLSDDKIRDVVRVIGHVGLTLTDVDALGAAFEAFFGTVFREELGQYFTPRPLVRFAVAMLMPEEGDIILDPTAGTGGFLLEALFQVWKKIDTVYAGQPEMERRKYDFARQHLYGIEINPVVGRVCQTSLLVHRDGHTNVEVSNTCLNRAFENPRISYLDPPFSLVLGNPPFGDDIQQGDSDRLGTSQLEDFEVARDRNKIASELVVLERSIQFLAPGGRLGMVVPDGVLNNGGEQSKCPAFRRFLLKNAKITAVISLPDHAFRKQGAQNKTSLLFCQRYSSNERREFDFAFTNAIEVLFKENEFGETELESAAIHEALRAIRYRVFLSEAEQIGYTPTGIPTPANDLFCAEDRVPNYEDKDTILGQYFEFMHDQDSYEESGTQSCMAEWVDTVFAAHQSHRLDPKYHLSKREVYQSENKSTIRYSLGEVLVRRRETVIPYEVPDEEFLTLTLTQDGELRPREAGLGNNPPAWFGVYFKPGAKWYRARTDDLIISRIDLWKGCVSVIPEEFEGAIVTQEFPLYRVKSSVLRPYYLKLLLRTEYFRRAVKAVTTGHSNRRRTQDDDFEALEVFLPTIEVQDQIIEIVVERESRRDNSRRELKSLLADVEKCITGNSKPIEVINKWNCVV